jgi:hypothetical protein
VVSVSPSKAQTQYGASLTAELNPDATTNAVDVKRSIQAKGDEFIKYAKERISEL